MAGRKNQLTQYNVLNAVSMASTQTSSVTDIRFLDDIGMQFTWTGSPTGTFQVQVSADYNDNNPSEITGNWVPVLLSYWNGTMFVTGTTIPTSVGSPIYIDLALLSAPYIRTVYTAGSGSGTLTATITAKML